MFTTFPSQTISVAQYQINTVINMLIEGGNRTNQQKQHCFYGSERYKDLKIVLQNRFRLSKEKSSLRSQWSEEIAKSIYNNVTFIDARTIPKHMLLVFFFSHRFFS